MKEQIQKHRKEYTLSALSESTITENPISLFTKWFQEALDIYAFDANAMQLATADKNARPTTRTVLLKSFDHKGFVFFTNYNSRKGKNLSENSWASINFFWHALERQIRIDGKVERIAEKESDEYFATRPRESQIGTWCSNQSEKISGREILEKKYKEIEQQYEGKTIPRPSYWGGYILKPALIEFWQGRENRLHDRFQYTKEDFDKWSVARLSP